MSLYFVLRSLVFFLFYELKIILKIIFSINYNFKSDFNNKTFGKISKKKNYLNYKITNSGKILVESLVVHPAYFIQNIILANHMRSILGHEIILILRKEDKFALKLCKSFNIKKIIFIDEPKFKDRAKNFLLAIKICSKINNIEKLLSLKHEGIFLGKLIYDNILRIEAKGTQKKVDGKVFYSCLKFLNFLSTLKKINKDNKIKYLLQDENQFFPASIFFQFFLTKKVQCYIKSGGRDYVTLSRYNNVSNAFRNPLKFSKKLIYEFYNNPKKNKFVKSGKFLMNKRLRGQALKRDIIDAVHFQHGEKISRNKLCKIFNWDPKKHISLILANDLTDGVTIGRNLKSSFNDNLSWLLYLFNQAKNQKNINWIIKEHPSDEQKKVKKGTKYYFKKLLNNNNVKLFPKNYSARSLIFIVNSVFSDHGSAGLEYPFCKIPCVTSSESLYHGLGFTHELESKNQLKNVIKNYKKLVSLKKIDKKKYDLLCIFLDIYIKKSKIKINMPFYDPSARADHDLFVKQLYYRYSIKKGLYNKLFHAKLKNQLAKNYRHTLNI